MLVATLDPRPPLARSIPVAAPPDRAVAGSAWSCTASPVPDQAYATATALALKPPLSPFPSLPPRVAAPGRRGRAPLRLGDPSARRFRAVFRARLAFSGLGQMRRQGGAPEAGQNRRAPGPPSHDGPPARTTPGAHPRGRGREGHRGQGGLTLGGGVTRRAGTSRGDSPRSSCNVAVAQELARRAVPAKADSLHPHDLRHDFVTLSLDAGASLWDVQDAAMPTSNDPALRPSSAQSPPDIRSGWTGGIGPMTRR